MAIKKFKVILVDTEVIAPNVKHMTFRSINSYDFSFKPGQFITFIFNQENKILRRSYSIATIPRTSKNIEIAISYVSKGFSSDILFNLEVGQELNVMGPLGKLILPKDTADIRNIVLMGTNTGITPYRSMINSLKEIENYGHIYILLGVKYRSDIIYSKDFLLLEEKNKRIKFISCLSREKFVRINEFKGYVQGYLRLLDLDSCKDIVYLCGNPNMVDDTRKYLHEINFSSEKVIREKYISSN